MKNDIKKSKVVLLKCDSYIPQQVLSTIKRGLSLLGGIKKFFNKNEKVLLKPNLLGAHSAEKAVTTHPEIVRAIGTICLEAGLKVSYGDSSPRGSARKIAKVSGIAEVADELAIPYVDFEEGETISFSQGKQNKQFLISKQVLAADGMISLPKFKTHNLTRFTGAVKNQFGCIPGFNKPEFHVKLPEVSDFSKMTVDLSLFLKPRLYIMDGIVAMQGNGPAAGTPYPLNLIMLSDDPVAIDSTACKILDLKPERVASNYYGEKYGLGNMNANNIDILGLKTEEFFAPEFDIERGPAMEANRAWKYRFLKKYLAKKPVIDADKCNFCKTCIDQCPVDPKAIFSINKTQIPQYVYGKCIRCYCCQEICPEGAIYIKSPLLRKIVEYFYS